MSHTNNTAIKPLKKNTSLLRLKARRKLWLNVHLWLGLTAGAALLLIGLTGSILVFWQEIDAWLNPQLLQVEVPDTKVYLSPVILAETSKSMLPEQAEISWIEFPNHSHESLVLNYSMPSLSVSGEMDEWKLYIDPFSAQIKGTRLWYPADYFSGMDFIPLIFKLHYALLMKTNGMVFVGIIAVILIISVLTGLILWWPLTHKWHQALTIKFKASKERLIFDLHKTAGFYGAIVLLAVLMSGVSMNLPEQFTNVIGVFSPLSSVQQKSAKENTLEAVISWGDAAEIVDKNYPEGRISNLSPPQNEMAGYQVCKKGILSLNRFVSTRCVFVGQYSGEILSVNDQKTGSAGDVFLKWQWPLHSGQAFGWAGRILVFLTGINCVVLYVTGVIRWCQKRRVKRALKKIY
ncbi:hypothetical protein AU255_00705 [Methyloprofundus sedimenti]|uniref:Peptidase n=1 Tax=Methyloprofundus sedimenti TaxID=1420851 RepID=A0A1V8M4I1_9GAMM|nr:PepSY-associated TM helix domain-containing protein [Methyloprofundus sedimenti]OQK16461.1 hypothetical protein AU255_00705 [Methyloprofundus sedimenti]